MDDTSQEFIFLYLEILEGSPARQAFIPLQGCRVALTIFQKTKDYAVNDTFFKSTLIFSCISFLRSCMCCINRWLIPEGEVLRFERSF